MATRCGGRPASSKMRIWLRPTCSRLTSHDPCRTGGVCGDGTRVRIRGPRRPRSTRASTSWMRARPPSSRNSWRWLFATLITPAGSWCRRCPVRFSRVKTSAISSMLASWNQRGMSAQMPCRRRPVRRHGARSPRSSGCRAPGPRGHLYDRRHACLAPPDELDGGALDRSLAVVEPRVLLR